MFKTDDVGSFQTPLRQITNTTKRLQPLSLNKKDLLSVKKKKLEFLEAITNSEKVIIPTEQDPLNKTDKVNESSLDEDDANQIFSQIVDIKPNDDILHDSEFMSEMQQIEFLKQKHLHRRVKNGFTVKPGRIKTNINVGDDLDNFPLSQLPSALGFKSASESLNITSSTTKHKTSTNKPSKSLSDRITEVDDLINVWRQGLRDSIEYLSCLSYPPTDIEEIKKYFSIKSEWLND